MQAPTILQRLGSFSLALVLTTGMLISIQGLAVGEPSAAQLARATAAASATS
jgi:hypothetical protein